MIVRILTEGQFNLPGAYVDELNEIDNQLVEVVESDDAEQFPVVLNRMLDLVSLSSPTSSSPSRTSPSRKPRKSSPARDCSPTEPIPSYRLRLNRGASPLLRESPLP